MLSVQELMNKEVELRSRIEETKSELDGIRRLLHMEGVKQFTGRDVRVLFYGKLETVEGPLSVVVCEDGGKPFMVPTLSVGDANTPF